MRVLMLLVISSWSFSVYGGCPKMRKSGYKAPTSTYSNSAHYNNSSVEQTKDPKVYKFSVNEDKFKTLSDARKYMTMLQKEAKKESRKLEVIKVDRYNYKVISEKDAEEEYSQLSPSAK
jgi:hypothetical protein